MTRAVLPGVLSRFVAVAMSLLAALPLAWAQDFVPPRNRFDQPDFSGIWQALDPAPHFNVEPHAASYGIPAGKGVVRSPADGLIPYTAAGFARREANRAALETDPIGRCYKPGVPHM